MSDRIILVDTANRLRTFNLPHEQYCAVWGQCSCSNVVLMRSAINRKGERVLQPDRRRLCKSITILPRGESEVLHEAALECDEVKGALNTTPPSIIVRRAGSD